MVTVNQDVAWYDIDTLSEWNENPNEGDVGKIIVSILRWGFIDELNVYNNEIMAGNHRREALLEIRRMSQRKGKEKANAEKAIRMSTRLKIMDDGRWLVGASDISHLPNRNEAQGYALASNRLAHISYDDSARLISVINEITLEGKDIVVAAGFDDEDINDVMASLTEGLFMPEYNPDEKEQLYSEDDLKRAQKKLKDKFKTNDSGQVEFCCPYCVTPIYLDKKDFVENDYSCPDDTV